MCKVGSVFRTMCARNHLESNWCYCRRDRAGLCFDDSAGELEISCGWGWITEGVVNQNESASAEGDNDRSADWCRSASDAQLAVRQSQTTVRVRFKGSGVPKAPAGEPSGLLRQFKLSFAMVVFCALEGQCVKCTFQGDRFPSSSQSFQFRSPTRLAIGSQCIYRYNESMDRLLTQFNTVAFS